MGIAPANYFEIDFPEVCKKKTAIIQSRDKLKNMISEEKECAKPVYINSLDYKLVGGNLAEIDNLEKYC
eukprot:TRINITY_DN10313_c0_g1_i1.p1 TRINITY_DN10313_c0_g1~~TRINITY_DN10313_c0_g1_i1.p1  ORF type:complete len:69 (+),score=12.02 TRINITY_DN10313_c0_g1_i1:140-346(+)